MAKNEAVKRLIEGYKTQLKQGVDSQKILNEVADLIKEQSAFYGEYSKEQVSNMLGIKMELAKTAKADKKTADTNNSLFRELIEQIKAETGLDVSQSFMDRIADEFVDLQEFAGPKSDESIDKMFGSYVNILKERGIPESDDPENYVLELMRDLADAIRMTFPSNEEGGASTPNMYQDMIKTVVSESVKAADTSSLVDSSFKEMVKGLVTSAHEKATEEKIFMDSLNRELKMGGQELRKLLGDAALDDDAHEKIIEELINKVVKDNGLNFADAYAYRRDMVENVKNAVEQFQDRNNIFSKLGGTLEDFYGTKAGIYLKKGIENTMSTVKSEIDTILGDIKGYFIDPVWDALKAAWGFFNDDKSYENTDLTLSKIANDTLMDISNSMEKMLGVSQEQLDMNEEERLRRLREKGPDEKGFLDNPLTVILGTAGAAIGAFVGLVWNQFRIVSVLLDSITGNLKPFGKALEFVKDLAVNLKTVAAGKLLGWFEWITKFTSGMPKIAGMVTKGIEFASKYFKFFVKALRFGVKTLAWPLQIILSVFDFFKGFMGTEGSFLDKMKGGLFAVVEGLIELPVKFLGLLLDLIPGIEGSAQTIMDSIKWAFGIAFDILTWPAKFFGYMWDSIQNIDWKDGFLKGMLKLFEKIGAIPGMLWDYVKEQAKGMPIIGKLFFGGDDEKSKSNIVLSRTDEVSTPQIKDTIDYFPEMGRVKSTESMGAVTNAVTAGEIDIMGRQVAGQQEINRSVNRSGIRMTDTLMKSHDSTASMINVIQQGNNAPQDPPADIETISLLFFNKAWGIT